MSYQIKINNEIFIKTHKGWFTGTGRPLYVSELLTLKRNMHKLKRATLRLNRLTIKTHAAIITIIAIIAIIA